MCSCLPSEHGDHEIGIGSEDIIADGLIKKGTKDHNKLEVAIGDGMEFTIHGDTKTKSKKSKHMMNNAKVIFLQNR